MEFLSREFPRQDLHSTGLLHANLLASGLLHANLLASGLLASGLLGAGLLEWHCTIVSMQNVILSRKILLQVFMQGGNAAKKLENKSWLWTRDIYINNGCLDTLRIKGLDSAHLSSAFISSALRYEASAYRLPGSNSSTCVQLWR